MEQVSCQQHHINIPLLRQAHDLVEASPAIIATNVVSLAIANMIICSHQDANGVGR